MAGRAFDPMHRVEVRPPHAVKKYGDPTKPYLIIWDYPLFKSGRYVGSRTRHTKATREKALTFAIEHAVYRDRMPAALRKELLFLRRTAQAVAVAGESEISE